MLTKLKGLSRRAKIALGSGLALLVAAGAGLGIWQPWNQQAEPAEEPDSRPQQVVQQPQAPAEKTLSVKAGGEEVPCTLYEGDGWSIYVPDGWTAAGGAAGGVTLSGSGAALEVAQDRQPAAYDGTFVCAAAGESGGKELRFYAGDGTNGSWTVSCGAPGGADWQGSEKLLTALTRTLKVGDQEIFADSFVLPQEPDWQVAEGMTVLFQDKDGVILDDKVQGAVEGYMLSWPEETKAAYTGQYRLNAINWSCTFTGLTDGYIDVFEADVSYQAAEGGDGRALAGDVLVENGWAHPARGVLLAVYHDGGTVEKTRWLDGNAAADWAELAGLLA